MRTVAVVLVLVGGCTFSPPEPAPAVSNEDPTRDAAVPDDTFPVPATPWLEPWAHRKRITVRRAVGAPLENVPIAIARDDADIMTAALPGATDLVFTAADQVTLLASEIEHATSADFIAWVKLPRLSDAEDLVIYAYYGNEAATAAPNATAEVWT